MTMLKPIATDPGVVKASYPDNGDTKEIEVNFVELECKEITKTNNTYPDLNTQADGSIRAIERIKEHMLLNVSAMCRTGDLRIIHLQLDAIINRLFAELYCLKDNENNDTYEWFEGVANDVYDLVELSKKLLVLHQDRACMDVNIRQLKYAQKGVLI